MNFVDLHTHSTCSDGTNAPVQLVRAAKAAGLCAVALTDHDTVKGINEACEEGKRLGIEVVPGIEMSAAGSLTVHIIGLYIDHTDEALTAFLHKARNGRDLRNAAIVQKLADAGFDICAEDIRPEDGKAITRANIGRALVEKGYAETMPEAVTKFLRLGKVGYVELTRLRAREIIEAIKKSGGISVLCHINQIGTDEEGLQALVKEYVSYGLDAIETVYAEYDERWRVKSKSFALQYGLLESGGSDFHGSDNRNTLGAANVPSEFLHRIKERLN